MTPYGYRWVPRSLAGSSILLAVALVVYGLIRLSGWVFGCGGVEKRRIQDTV